MAPGLYTGVRDGNKLVKVVQRGDVEQTQTHWRLPVAPRSPRLRSIRELQRHQRRRCDDDERAHRSMCDAVASLPGGGAAADCIFRKGEWAYSLSKPRQALCFRVRGLLWPGLFLNSQHVRGIFSPFFSFSFFSGSSSVPVLSGGCWWITHFLTLVLSPSASASASASPAVWKIIFWTYSGLWWQIQPLVCN